MTPMLFRIGYAIAKRMAEDGCSVMISSRKEGNVTKALETLKKEGLNVEGMPCHVGKEQDRENMIAKTLEKFGGIDILISNAAANPFFGNTLDVSLIYILATSCNWYFEILIIFQCTEDQWEKIFDINVKCAFLLTKSVVPHIIKRGGGSIVYITSIGGYSPVPVIHLLLFLCTK